MMENYVTGFYAMLPVMLWFGAIFVLAWFLTSVQMERPMWVRFIAVQMRRIERLLLWASRRLPEPMATKAFDLSEQFDVRNRHWAAEALAETCLGCLYKADLRRPYDVEVDGL